MRHYSGRDPDGFNGVEALAVLRRIVVFLVVVYGLVSLGAHFLAMGMIFPRPPIRYVMTSDYVQVTASDGTKLAARHWVCPGAKFTLLYLHGNYEDLGRVGEYVSRFQNAGYSVFSIDYRGYGQSGGTPTESNTYSDVQRAYEYLRADLGIPADRIVIWGYSVGSGPAVELALHQPAAGLVLQSAYVSAYRVMTGIPLVLGDKFVNLRKVPDLRLPVFVIHGTDDRTIPSWHGEALYSAITARKAKLFIPSGSNTPKLASAWRIGRVRDGKSLYPQEPECVCADVSYGVCSEVPAGGDE